MVCVLIYEWICATKERKEMSESDSMWKNEWAFANGIIIIYVAVCFLCCIHEWKVLIWAFGNDKNNSSVSYKKCDNNNENKRYQIDDNNDNSYNINNNSNNDYKNNNKRNNIL